jgi:hypothetical protein
MATQHKGAQNHTSAAEQSIMRVELMKRRGIMPTLPMAMLATHGIMQRKHHAQEHGSKK